MPNINNKIINLIKSSSKPDEVLDQININLSYADQLKIKLFQFIPDNEELQDRLRVITQYIFSFKSQIGNESLLSFLIIHIYNTIGIKYLQVPLAERLYKDFYLLDHIVVQLVYTPQYIQNVIDIFSSISPYYLSELLISKSGKSILGVIEKEEYAIIIERIHNKNMVRKCYYLYEIIRKIIVEYQERTDLIETTITYFKNNNKNLRDKFYGEIVYIIELSMLYPSIFIKIIDMEPTEQDKQFFCNYEKECSRLLIEYHRIMRHPSMTQTSQQFYVNEISRLNNLRDLILKIIDRIDSLKKIRENKAALTIQESWYRYITKICHPDHPRTRERYQKMIDDISKR